MDVKIQNPVTHNFKSAPRKYNQHLRPRNRRPCHPELDAEIARKKISKEDPRSQKLSRLLKHPFEVADINGQRHFYVTLEGLLKRLNWLLREFKIRTRDDGIRLVGSAASYILSSKDIDNLEEQTDFSDIDITIYVEESIKESSASLFFRILQCEEETLKMFFEEVHFNEDLTLKEICDNYFLERLRVENEEESWSLISVGSGGRNIDIKFIQKSRRSYVFSTDSFEIILDSLLHRNHSSDGIIYESLYGSVDESQEHLNSDLLKAKNPEEVRRGLMRLCLELSKGRTFEDPAELELVERTFCQEFFQNPYLLSQFPCSLDKFLWKHPKQQEKFLTYLDAIIRRYDGPVESELRNDVLAVVDRCQQKLASQPKSEC